MKKETLRNLVRFLVKTLTRTEYIGLERIPASGGVIIAINHISYFDTPILFVNPARSDITALVTTKYLDNPLVKWFTEIAGGIWINRDIADFTAIQAASKALAQGLALGIAPEGTRSQTAQLQEGKPGTIMLALKSGAPIVPIGITGTENAINKLLRLRRPRISVNIGEPIILPEFHPHQRSTELKRWTEILMRRIAALLPPEYRGVYKD